MGAQEVAAELSEATRELHWRSDLPASAPNTPVCADREREGEGEGVGARGPTIEGMKSAVALVPIREREGGRVPIGQSERETERWIEWCETRLCRACRLHPPSLYAHAPMWALSVSLSLSLSLSLCLCLCLCL